MDAQILLLFALARPLHDRAWLLAHDTELLNEAQQHRWDQALQRRLRGEPVAYITGHKDFFGLTLNVDARVLDPRPDTEILVEWALALLPAGQAARVLDLGTGRGAVALALQHHRPSTCVPPVHATTAARGRGPPPPGGRPPPTVLSRLAYSPRAGRACTGSGLMS